MKSLIFLFIPWVFVLVECSDSDYYTSMLGLHKLAKVEQEIVNQLKDYVNELENRIEKANAYLEDYRESVLGGRIEPETQKYQLLREKPVTDGELGEMAMEISSHPLKSFRLVRRLARELPEIEKLLQGDFEKDLKKIMEKTREGVVPPQIEDVRGAIEGLLRIQDAYDLNIYDFSRGEFEGLETFSGLRAVDLYQVGFYALNSTIYTRAIEWLERAYIATSEEGDTSISPQVVREKLVEAIESHNEVLNGAAASIKFLSNNNKYLFSSPVLTNGSDRGHRVRVLALHKFDLYQKMDNWGDLTNFVALCRGEILQPPEATKDLNCWFEHGHPNLYLSPIKVEMHHKNPPVLQFYDLIRNDQIDKVLELTRPHFSRAKVLGKDNLDTKEVSLERTSSTAWIVDDDYELLKTLPKTIEYITGLKLLPTSTAAETIQVSSYGIGGHYKPHFDNLFRPEYLHNAAPHELSRGDRIATIMFYLSNVERGGGTAFPRLGVAAKPIKGSAIFWFNQKRNGEADPWALHGGCPIIYGKKDVLNKWIRANAQILTRPCSLNPDE